MPLDHIVEGNFETIADPKLEAIAVHAKRAVILAAIKATAHAVDPGSYPMPAQSGSLEGIILERLQKIDAASKQVAGRKLKAFVALPSTLKARQFGVLSKVDLRSAQPVAAQADTIGLPAVMRFDRAHLDRLLTTRSFLAKSNAPLSPGLRPQADYNKLELRIHKVKCEDETNPEWPGDDEILLGGVTIDESGDVTKVPAFTVSSSFDDGESKVYSPPKRFAYFDLTEQGNKWPKTYYATMVFAEEDNGGFPDFLEKLLHKVKDYVAPLIGSAIGAGIGAAAGAIGSVLGALVGAVLGAFINWIIEWWEDDIFPALKRYAIISSYNHVFSSGTHTSTLKYSWTQAHGGRYGVYYDWRVFA
jgi:hypothetical protein